MAIRLVKCDRCGHSMRFGAESCGDCSNRAPMLNRLSFYSGALIVVLLIALAGMLVKAG